MQTSNLTRFYNFTEIKTVFFLRPFAPYKETATNSEIHLHNWFLVILIHSCYFTFLIFCLTTQLRTCKNKTFKRPRWPRESCVKIYIGGCLALEEIIMPIKGDMQQCGIVCARNSSLLPRCTYHDATAVDVSDVLFVLFNVTPSERPTRYIRDVRHTRPRLSPSFHSFYPLLSSLCF